MKLVINLTMVRNVASDGVDGSLVNGMSVEADDEFLELMEDSNHVLRMSRLGKHGTIGVNEIRVNNPGIFLVVLKGGKSGALYPLDEGDSFIRTTGMGVTFLGREKSNSQQVYFLTFLSTSFVIYESIEWKIKDKTVGYGPMLQVKITTTRKMSKDL
jgi:hypothetical protein